MRTEKQYTALYALARYLVASVFTPAKIEVPDVMILLGKATNKDSRVWFKTVPASKAEMDAGDWASAFRSGTLWKDAKGQVGEIGIVPRTLTRERIAKGDVAVDLAYAMVRASMAKEGILAENPLAISSVCEARCNAIGIGFRFHNDKGEVLTFPKAREKTFLRATPRLETGSLLQKAIAAMPDECVIPFDATEVSYRTPIERKKRVKYTFTLKPATEGGLTEEFSFYAPPGLESKISEALARQAVEVSEEKPESTESGKDTETGTSSASASTESGLNPESTEAATGEGKARAKRPTARTRTRNRKAS